MRSSFATALREAFSADDTFWIFVSVTLVRGLVEILGLLPAARVKKLRAIRAGRDVGGQGWRWFGGGRSVLGLAKRVSIGEARTTTASGRRRVRARTLYASELAHRKHPVGGSDHGRAISEVCPLNSHPSEPWLVSARGQLLQRSGGIRQGFRSKKAAETAEASAPINCP